MVACVNVRAASTVVFICSASQLWKVVSSHRSADLIDWSNVDLKTRLENFGVPELHKFGSRMHSRLLTSNMSVRTAVGGPGRSAAVLLQEGQRQVTVKALKQTEEQVESKTQDIQQILGNIPLAGFVDALNKIAKVAPGAGVLDSSNQEDARANIDLERLSVVRIHSIQRQANWYQPYDQLPVSEAIGSGFAVELSAGVRSDDDPIFLTNAHVVRNAFSVGIQLPAVGQLSFPAYVPLICSDFDLAVVRLFRPKEFVKALQEQQSQLHILPVGSPRVTLGMEVEAVGFPLGSDSLKISRGVIAGTEQVSGEVSYQSTAPISPGNSGGPLFSLAGGKLELVGVNFAASTGGGAQNVNYVIPIIHIRQVLDEFAALSRQDGDEAQRAREELRQKAADVKARRDKAADEAKKTSGQQKAQGQEQLPKASAGKVMPTPEQQELERAAEEVAQQATQLQQAQPPHHVLRIAPVDVLGVEGNKALYSASGKCSKGFYIAKLGERSVFKLAADPPMPEKDFFLLEVMGLQIDSFGMGRMNDDFLSDPMPFESIMGTQANLREPMSVKICQKSKEESEHKVSMSWDAKFQPGIKAVMEPFFEAEALQFEIFSGVTFMQMSINHIMGLVQAGRPTLGRWLLPEMQHNPKLLVTDVRKGTYASRNLAPGMVVKKINGVEVNTLEDYRAHFEPQGCDYWTMETDRGVLYQQLFEDALKEQYLVAKQSRESYVITSAVEAAINKRVKAQQVQALKEKLAQLQAAGYDTAELEKQLKVSGMAFHGAPGNPGRSPDGISAFADLERALAQGPAATAAATEWVQPGRAAAAAGSKQPGSAVSPSSSDPEAVISFLRSFRQPRRAA